MRIIVLLAAVLALNSADGGTIGAVAVPLEDKLGIGPAEIGIIAAGSAAVGAVLAPIGGIAADRRVRVRILTMCIAVWSAAMIFGGLAPSYPWLLLSRVALGGALAFVGPVVASLIGDFFAPRERARIYGWVLAGELVGGGIGLVAGTELAALVSWRLPFFVLGGASLVLGLVVRRYLAEPVRGGSGWLRPDAAGEGSRPPSGTESEAGERRPAGDRTTSRVDVENLSPWAAARYVLSVPTMRILVASSVIGYFFFAGLRTFAVVFAVREYDLSASLVGPVVVVIGIGALVGVQVGGRVADRVYAAGRPSVRVVLPAVAYSAAALLFGLGLIRPDLILGIALFTPAAAALGAANPPLDAARLDIMPAELWGRAESVRTTLRLCAEAIAPLLFGLTANALGGQHGNGLQYAFLIMLVPLLVNGVMLSAARRTYQTDVARIAPVGAVSQQPA